ncbi:MAG: hypothetical protein AB7T63_01635 [Planctomycetota bacterium]
MIDTTFLRPRPRGITRLGPLALGLAALAFAVLGTAGAARAEDGPGSDLEEQIRKQMQHIRELMEANERALFELSTGKDAKPKEVDVTLPPPDGSSGGAGGSGGSAGGSGGEGASGGAGGTAGGGGEGAAKEIERLLEDLEKASEGSGGGMIPDELKRLVEMIPT